MTKDLTPSDKPSGEDWIEPELVDDGSASRARREGPGRDAPELDPGGAGVPPAGGLLYQAFARLKFLFVMAVGNIFKVIDLFSRGVPGLLILQVFSYGIPFSLIFAIPMSVMAAAFLIFSRMASDRELIAMKACGISLWQVVQPPVFIAAVLSLVCIYINCNLAPDSHYARRTVLGKLGVETPLSLLDEGRFIRDFPGFTIYISRKDGYRVSDIVIYEFNSKGVKQTVRAKSGMIEADKDNPGKIVIHLYKVRIDQADDQFPNDLSRTKRLSAEEYPVNIDVAELMNRGIIWKKRADLTMMEIFKTIRGSMLLNTDDFTDKADLSAQSLWIECVVFSYKGHLGKHGVDCVLFV